jgi:CHAD domain-containing protein
MNPRPGDPTASWHATYRLRSEESPGEGLARIVADQLARAAADLGDAESDPVEAVHEARKSLKRARSALRLVRDPLGPRFSELNDQLRSFGRLLAPRREADAALVTLQRLAERDAGPGADELAAARSRIEALRSEVPDARTAVALALDAMAVDLTADLPDSDWELLASGLRRAYRRGRRAMRAAAGEGTPTAYHAWRKRVKDLWHHTEILADASPALLEPAARNVHALAELLGDIHDLDELDRLLAPSGEETAADRVPAGLRELIAEMRAEAIPAALQLGEQTYAERPKAFVRRVEAYWRAWRREAAAPAAPARKARPATKEAAA